MTAVESLYSGNRIQKTEGGVTTTYTYDDENRLTEITRGADTIIYAYDPLGRRIAKSVNNVVTWYVYDGNAIIAAYDLSGTVTARYAHGLNIDEPLAVQRGSVTSYYHANGLGSIVALTNVAGAVVQTYSYDTFGNITSSGGINQPYTYTAREYDTETGLYYYRARYYDPKAGRFITRDPISFTGGDVNLYAYVGNNPIRWKDPQGKAAPWTHSNDGYIYGITHGMTGAEAEAFGTMVANVDFGSLKDAPDAHATRLDLITPADVAIKNTWNFINGQNLGTPDGLANAIHALRDIDSQGGVYYPSDPSLIFKILHILKYDLIPNGSYDDVIGKFFNKKPCK